MYMYIYIYIYIYIHTHTHNGILLSHEKKNKILQLATTQIDLEGVMLSEVSQTEKDRMVSLICGI